MTPTPGDVSFVAPAYGSRSIADVLPAVAAALGVPGLSQPDPEAVGEPSLALPEAPRYVVLLVDGLGYQQLRDHAAEAPFLRTLLTESEEAGLSPATVGVPSTTATSLTSLGTALSSGQHGVVGYTSRIPGTDRLLNALQWDPAVDPRQWQPHPTMFGRLAAAGVDATVVNHRSFAGSGLTVASQSGARFVGADRVGERLAAATAAASTAPSLTYLYDGDLDWTGHTFGVDSPAWRHQLAMVDAQAEQLRAALPADARLVVVADHGMVDSPLLHRIEVDDDPDLQAGVALLGGEARFRHLYCRSGAVDDVASTWSAVLGARAEVLVLDDALARGWFGPLLPDVRPRLGDVVVASRGTHAVQQTSAFPAESRLVGLHGSLTPAEMLIPVLLA
jgi:hypothetical protein